MHTQVIDATGQVQQGPARPRVWIEPLGDRVVVDPIPDSETTESGLHKPDIAREAPQTGVVMAVGPGRMNDAGQLLPMSVKPGAVVLYGKYSGTFLPIDGHGGRPIMICRESDLLAVLRREVPADAPDPGEVP